MSPLTIVGFFDIGLSPHPGQDLTTLRLGEQADLDRFTSADGDLLVVCYALASGDPTPRLTKGTSYYIEAHGDAVVANYLLLDVDRAPHAPWPSPGEASRYIEGALERAMDAAGNAMDFKAGALLETAAWYATPRGYRLMWALAEPLPIRQYEGLFQRAAKMLAKYDILVDTATADWTRLSYTPRAKGREPACEFYDTLVSGGLDVVRVFGNIPETPDVPAKKASAGTLEDIAPMPSTWEHWAVLPAWLQSGPLPGENSGDCFRTMREVIATLARVLPDEELSEDVVLRALVTAYNATAAAGNVGSWSWSDVEGLVGHVLANEEAQRKSLAKMDSWFRPRPPDTVPVVATTVGSSPPDTEPASSYAEPDAPTEEDLDRLRSVATNQKLRSIVDRLMARRIPTTEAQSAARRDMLRTLVERAFAARAGYRELSPQEIAESLYRVLGTYIETTGMQSVDELVGFLQQVGKESAESRRREARRSQALAALQEDLPPLLARGDTGTYYVLDSRGPRETWTYVPAASAVLGQVLRTYAFPGIPEELHISVSGPRGGLRPASEFVESLNAPIIQQVAYDYDVTRAVLEGDLLVLPTLQRPSITPRYHPAVDAWLVALAGDDETYNTLVNWLVAAQDLSLPLQCLYLTGSGGSGKSLLQKGLARLWGGRFADFNNYLLENFQEQMLLTPLLVADDGITVDPRSVSRVSNVFRQVLTEDTRAVNIKFQPKCLLRGHFRLVVSSNGDTGIPFTQALGRDALMALAERIFHIEVGAVARDVLEGFRGTPDGEDFITPTGGKIPEHLLYLATAVQLPPIRRRFAVEVPRYAAWAEAWSAEQGILPEARTAVSYILRSHREGKTVAGCSGIIDDPTHVLVQLSAIRVGWKAVSSHRSQPNNKELRAALEDLSTRAMGCDYGKQRYGAQRVIDGGARVRGYLFPLGYCDVDTE